MSECIMWPSSSLKSQDFEMRKPLKCKSEWLNSYRTKCFCEPVANDLFFTVVKVAKPTSTIAPSTTTSNLTAAPASTTQPLSNSTNQVNFRENFSENLTSQQKLPKMPFALSSMLKGISKLIRISEIS